MKKRQRKQKKQEVWTVNLFPRVSLTERCLPLISEGSIIDLFKAIFGIGEKKCQR